MHIYAPSMNYSWSRDLPVRNIPIYTYLIAVSRNRAEITNDKRITKFPLSNPTAYRVICSGALKNEDRPTWNQNVTTRTVKLRSYKVF